jgi:hypothetical protein
VTFYIDLDLLRTVYSLSVRRVVEELRVRRGDMPQFEVRFCRRGVIVDPGSVNLFFVVKPEGEYDQNPPLVLTGPFTKSGIGSSAKWTAQPIFASSAIDTLLGVDAIDTNDLPSIEAMAEFSWTAQGSAVSAASFACVIENNVYRASDTSPGTPPVPNFPFVLGSIVGLTGGGGTNLDGIPTLGMAPIFVVHLILNGGLESWALTNGTNAEDGVGYVRPDDFNATTNAKVWVRVA